MSPTLRDAITALDVLSDRVYHEVFEDGSQGGDHIEPIRAALSLLMVCEPVYQAAAEDEFNVLRNAAQAYKR
jgi:hypothetical protein